MKTQLLEAVYRVWDDNEGVHIEVGESYEIGSGFIEIRTTDEKSKTWYGNVNFTLPAENAKALGHALLKAVEDVENNKKV